MNGIWVYALPSISAIAIKIVMIWYGRNILRRANVWVLVFLGGLFGVNLCELLAFSPNTSASTALTILVAYYVFAVVANAGLLAIAMQLAGRFSVRIQSIIFLSAAAGVIVLLVPGAAISGAQSIGYSLTRVPGPFYWVLQALIPTSLLITTVTLVYTALRSGEWTQRRRALALLVGSLPLVVAVLIVMLLMHLGVAINAAVVVSLAINILLGVLMYTEYETGIFRFLSFVPRTQENRLVFHAARSAYDLSSQGLSSAVANFERALIDDALTRSRGNKTAAANLLGVSRTTLRRKMTH